MPSEASASKKIPWLKLIVVAVVIAVGALLVLRGLNVRGYLEQGMALIRSASPLVFFVALALLPAVGAPVLPFILAAGPLWTEKLGMGHVVLYCMAALTVNFTMSYWLARKAFRPLLTRIVTRLGYKLPRAEEGDATSLIVIMRVTTGIPYCVQNYLLGLAEVPFPKYFLWTVVLSLPQSAAIIYFGDALMNGRGKMVIAVAGTIVALVAVTHLVRRHYAKKKKKA